jgi:hypothetical protein
LAGVIILARPARARDNDLCNNCRIARRRQIVVVPIVKVGLLTLPASVAIRVNPANRNDILIKRKPAQHSSICHLCRGHAMLRFTGGVWVMRLSLMVVLVCGLSPEMVSAQSNKPAATAPMPKEAQDALKAVTTKIAKSYSLLKDGKTEWTHKVTSAQRGKIDTTWAELNRHEIFCATIDPMIPTFTDWKIGNFVIYREEGALWVAEEGDKETFLRLSCKNWKDPSAK